MNNNPLKEIAKYLAKNYYDISLYTNRINSEDKNSNLYREKYTTIFSEEYRDLLKDEFNGDPLQQPITRNVVIIGAGATKDGFKEVKMASEFIELIKSKNGIDFNSTIKGHLTEKYDIERDRLRALYTTEAKDSLDFETELRLLTHFYPEQVIRDKITEHYNKRFYPCRVYEILAHLFKHRFIDVIINFNFDEMLDQAIINEMAGSSNFHYIYSDGHCVEKSQYIINGTFRKPIYIKPHGTASHPSTMKFTKEDYYLLPTAMKKQIEDVLSATIRIGQEEKEEARRVDFLNIITVGYAMKSLEVNQILRKLLTTENALKIPIKAKIFHFNIKSEGTRYPYPTSGIREIDDCVVADEGYQRAIFSGDGQTYKNLGHSFEALWNEIMLWFTDNYKPSNINDHLIISKLFHDEENRKRSIDDDIEYFEKRIYAEICISLMRTKDKIDLKQFINEGGGNYYTLYKNEQKKRGNSHHPFYYFFENLGLTNTGSIENQIFELKKIENLRIEDCMLIESTQKHKGTLYKLASEMSKERWYKESFRFSSLRIKPVATKKEQEMSYIDSYSIKNSVQSILTLQVLLEENIKKCSDLVLLSVEDYSIYNWIKTEINALPAERRPRIQTVLSQRWFRTSDHESVRYLPDWYQHQFMFIFLKKEQPQIESNIAGIKGWSIAGDSIFYAKYNFSSGISPIVIPKSSESDNRMLIDQFYLYWLKGFDSQKAQKESIDTSYFYVSKNKFEQLRENWLNSI